MLVAQVVDDVPQLLLRMGQGTRVGGGGGNQRLRLGILKLRQQSGDAISGGIIGQRQPGGDHGAHGVVAEPFEPQMFAQPGGGGRMTQQQFQQPKFLGRRRDRARRNGGGVGPRAGRRRAGGGGPGEFAEFGAHGVRIDGEAKRGFLGVAVHQHGVTGLVKGGRHCAQDRQPAAVGGRIVLPAEALQIVIEKISGFLNQPAKRRAAVGANVAVRIMRRGHDGHTHGQPGSQQRLERTDGGVLARVVGVETKHHLVHVPVEDAGVFGGERRPLRGHDIPHAGQVTGDQIELPLADHGEAGVEDGPFGFVQAVENLALGEDRGFR
ncbi:MAG: hypothetical protein BWX84_02191 [Verrucomicrobia bacterium ADurb.Bin118]|nr:MAG: hypothetical protein BWX84_02191 [Verrucomicrobia bacterium ADurb.Bin118]